MANDSGSKPMYEMIFHTLRERITNHEYKAGSGFPQKKNCAVNLG